MLGGAGATMPSFDNFSGGTQNPFPGMQMPGGLFDQDDAAELL